MKLNNKRFIFYQAGLSLVEVMVGLAIGLLVALIIMQVMSVFEGQKRSTTGTADAQTNGAIALYNIARELQFAGYPLMPSGVAGTPDSPLECTTVTYGATGITSISPVSITDGVAVAGVSASDSITIRYGDSTSGGVPTDIGGAPVGQVVTLGSLISPGSNFGCNVGDITIISNGTTCALSTITAKSAAGAAPPVTVTLLNTANAVSGANLACLGAWNTVTYTVDQTNGNLMRNGVAVVSGIVNLQAQYGISATAASNQVTQWVDANGATWGGTPTVANRNLIKSVRVAVIARNPKIEPAAVTTACSATNTAAPTGLCAWAGTPAVVGPPAIPAVSAPTVDLSQSNANWARYHYRVFETIIPLRNVVWSKDTL